MSSGSEESISGQEDGQAAKAKGKRRSYPKELKRRIVEETLIPGASVSRVAQLHGVNTNQVFRWRSLHERGLLGHRKKSTARLLPVTVTDPAMTAPGQLQIDLARSSSMRTPTPGTIHVELPKARLRIEGEADPSCLRTVLEYLLR
jgi:transposase